ncbi:hypothetical protein [Nevskia sp.]|uniref:hypothetical protein n=1 Tax=Nevskia sp. TaxID=1929292 RepID=UPI0025FFC009|nr:hypothetical protein [Nevskia sp.]
MTTIFDGQILTTPTTVARVDDTAQANVGVRSGNTVVILGSSTAGRPQTPLAFSSPPEARRVLRSGELLTAVERAFQPSPDTGGPLRVIAMRVDPATQSMLTLNDSTAAPALTLLSSDYGADTNRVKIRIEAGSVSGLRPTIGFDRAIYTRDNVARRAFMIRYTGAAASAVMTINGSTVTLAAPTGTTVATIDLASYTTVGALVDRISGTPGFVATVLDNNTARPTVNALDFVTAVDVRTADYIARADLQALIDYINSAAEGLVDAVRAPNAGRPPALLPFTFLTGGSNGAITNDSWATALEVLQAVDVQWVVPLSPLPAVHAMVDAHVQFMSSAGRKERRAIVGGEAGETMPTAISNAALLNSDRTSYCYPGYFDFDSAGQLQLYPGYMSAALVGGMAAGVAPGTPLTNKAISVRGLEVAVRNPTDTDALIDGGVLCLEDAGTSFRVVASVTTWTQSDNFNRVELSTGAATDFMVRAVRTGLDALRGQRGNPQTLARARQITDSVLRDLAVPEPNGPGVIVGDADNPAYRNIVVSLEGDRLSVTFEASPVIPVNYVTINIFATPYSATIAG